MPTPVFGTAQLFGLTPERESAAVLDAAWEAGFRAFDTAPLYGHGRSEIELGLRVGRWPERPTLTSKVGLEPEAAASRGVRTVKAAARRLPAGVQRRLRPGGDGPPHGSFDPEQVRASVERTVARLGRVDRLMLHEVWADDVTDDLLAVLSAFVARGDVGQLGVATGNVEAAAAVRRAPDLLTAAHLEIGPFAPAVEVPPTVTTVVGHGALGPGASALRRLSPLLAASGDAAERWRAATAGTRWAGPAGLAEALVARAAAQPVAAVIVSTSRPARLASLLDLASGAVPWPPEVAAALDALVAAAGPGIS